MILPDLLRSNLKIVFCGTAAGDKSADRKAYYAGRGNMFYYILATSGFTPKILLPEEYNELLNFDIGLTDLAKYTHGMDNTLIDTDYDCFGFRNKILQHQPKLVCFNGKEAAKVYLGLKSTKEVSLGLQKETIGSSLLFVAPSTSFSARKYWDESYWVHLKTLTENT